MYCGRTTKRSFKAFSVIQRIAGFARLLESNVETKERFVRRQRNPPAARRSEPLSNAIDSGEKNAAPHRRRRIACSGDRAAVEGRSETDPKNRSGERKRSRLYEGDHVTACAATPGPDDTRATRFLADVSRRCSGGRNRLPAVRDVAPHHTPGGGSTAERSDSAGDEAGRQRASGVFRRPGRTLGYARQRRARMAWSHSARDSCSG